MVEMDSFIDCGTTPFQGPTAAQKGLSPWTFQICTIIILTIQILVMLKEFIIIDMFTKPNITHITNNSLNHNSITIIAYKITCMFRMFDFTNTNLFLYNFFHYFLPWSSLYLKVSKFRKQIDLFSFEPKTEQNISDTSDPLVFVRFLEELRTPKSPFEIN